jgi:RNA polymerase sigma-70 factor (ECF subfamily)
MAEKITEQQDINTLYEKYVDTVYRICFSYMKNKTDTEDAVQETFLKLLQHKQTFENSEHMKAWLIVTASNHCKNILKHWWRKRQNIEECERECEREDICSQEKETLNAVLQLPDKYKTVVYLYYYEGYDSNEIAEILEKPASTIRSYLCKARKILKMTLK